MGHLDKCRVCFTAVARDDEAYNLLELPKLAAKFSDCTGLVVDPDDVNIIPSEICCQCYEQLEMYHAFRALSLTADRKWRLKKKVKRREIIQEEPMFLEENQEAQGQEMEQPSLQPPELILCDGNLSPKESPKVSKRVQRKASPKKAKPQVKIMYIIIVFNGLFKLISNKLITFQAQRVLNFFSTFQETDVISTSDTVYTCDLCSEEFDDHKRLVNHKKEHDGHSLYHCSESGCEQSFNRYEQCRQHELLHAAEGTRFICGEEGCHKMYRHKASLKLHQSKAHGLGEPPKTHMCEFCGRVFQNLAALTHHRHTHSDQLKLPFACEMADCTLRFISQEKLRIHMMRHQGIKNYSCPYCGLRKTTKNELRLHINFHTLERSWKCKYCSKVCNSSTSLKKHVNAIHEKKRDYACSYCEKSFANSNTRKYHEMTHTGEKNFECQECGKKFIQPAALRTHRLIHE
ncbi:hypothetical protein KR200_001499, partial [Drosophila serrata]